MADEEQLSILKQGAETWNRWREENEEAWVDLREADLRQADLRGAELDEADLRGANLPADLRGAVLSGANLRVAKLTEANLRGADLTGADLTGADLTGAILTVAKLTRAYLYWADLTGANLIEADLTGASLLGANLTEADLHLADLRGANLTEANLTGADLLETVFSDTNLTGATGLDTCIHRGPSTLDHRTLARNPHLPIEFLQGCGLSDLEVMSARLLYADLTPGAVTNIGYKIIELRSDPAIQYHSCFISYSSKNEDFARRLHDDLQDAGVRCWFAPEDLKIGDRIRRAIDDAIRLHDKLLLILSRPAIDSGWVAYEADRALSRELIDKRTILFPVRVDDSVFDVDEGWALHIKEDRHIGDFTDEARYETSFERLLRDLREGER